MLLLLFSAILIARPSWAQATLYNAALGTSPSAQGFVTAGNQPANYTVGNGALSADTSSSPGETLYFQQSTIPLDFAGSFSLAASFRLISSDCNAAGTTGAFPRNGFQINCIDDNYRQLLVQFCTDNVVFGTRDGPLSSGVVEKFTFQTSIADERIFVRIEAFGGMAYLLVNDVLRLQMPVAAPVASGTPPFKIYFGDGSGNAGSLYDLYYLRATTSQPNSAAIAGISTVSNGCLGLGPLSITGIPARGQMMTFMIPGSGGVPYFLAGTYEPQGAYCSSGCLLGIDLDRKTSFVIQGDVLAGTIPNIPEVVGWPFTIQGVRIGPGVMSSCSSTIAHSLTDIAVVVIN